MTTTPEALTPEERALIGSDTSNEDANAVHLARKLLRIHDQQAARIAELERGYGGPCPTCHRGYPVR